MNRAHLICHSHENVNPSLSLRVLIYQGAAIPVYNTYKLNLQNSKKYSPKKEGFLEFIIVYKNLE